MRGEEPRLGQLGVAVPQLCEDEREEITLAQSLTQDTSPTYQTLET